jgi:hypothetical protein
VATPPSVLDSNRVLMWLSPLQHGVRDALRWGSQHSGLPVVVVAAIVVVVSWKLARKAARLAVEVTVATALLLVATRLGWITW